MPFGVADRVNKHDVVSTDIGDKRISRFSDR